MIRKILITGFEPFGNWKENSSQLCVEELSKKNILGWKVITKIYPVEFKLTQRIIREDIQNNFDFAIHLGQIDSSNKINLEKIGLNVGKNIYSTKMEIIKLISGGPIALESRTPLEQWLKKVDKLNIPIRISYHAGTYLCNALFYWSLYYSKKYRLKTKSTFIHLPVIPSQFSSKSEKLLGLELEKSVKALDCIITDICEKSA